VPNDEPSHRDLVERCREGDPRAAEALFQRYAMRLARLAEQHLRRQVAARVDGEDVVQSVFRTFFRRCAGGEFTIDSSAQLWQLLVTITLNKARAHVRHHTAGRRDVAAEASGEAGVAPALAREPGPAEAAALVDQIETLLRGLPELYCHLLEMRLAGHTGDEIAAQLGVSRRTVYRALGLLQERLARSAGEGSP
jgi:RNA polymerase sigma factor (sigma-70 family)